MQERMRTGVVFWIGTYLVVGTVLVVGLALGAPVWAITAALFVQVLAFWFWLALRPRQSSSRASEGSSSKA